MGKIRKIKYKTKKNHGIEWFYKYDKRTRRELINAAELEEQKQEA